MKQVFWLVSMLAIATASSAAPHAWIPGSSVDGITGSGNRLVIVDLDDGSVVTSSEGFAFQPVNPGADAALPNFSPDGRFAYIVVGGDGDGDSPNGFIHVFDTEETIAILTATQKGGSPPIPTPLQSIEFVSSDEDAVEPVALTITPDGKKGFLVDEKEELLHFLKITTLTGEMELIDSIPTGAGPSPLWVTGDGAKGYFTNLQNFTLNIVDLTEGSFQITSMIPIPEPLASAPTGTVPFCTVTFPYPDGTSNYTVAPPNVAPSDDSKLLIFSGYAGVTAQSPIGNSTFNGEFHIYQLDTATGSLDNGGNPIHQVFPQTDQPTFPPFIHAFNHPDHGVFAQAAGTTMFKPDTSRDRLIPSEDDVMLLYGILPKIAAAPVRGKGGPPPGTDFYYIGSAAIPDALALAGGSYTPGSGFDGSADLFAYSIPPAGSRADVTTTRVADVGRNSALVLGEANGRIVVGGNDILPATFGTETTVSNPRDSVLLLFDPAMSSETEVALQIVAGAAGIAPHLLIERFDPTDSDGDGFTDQIEDGLNSDPNDPNSRPSFGDFDNDGMTTILDALAIIRQAGLMGTIEPYDITLDINKDDVVDRDDGLVLLNWAFGRPEVPSIPIAPNIPM